MGKSSVVQRRFGTVAGQASRCLKLLSGLQVAEAARFIRELSARDESVKAIVRSLEPVNRAVRQAQDEDARERTILKLLNQAVFMMLPAETAGVQTLTVTRSDDPAQFGKDLLAVAGTVRFRASPFVDALAEQRERSLKAAAHLSTLASQKAELSGTLELAMIEYAGWVAQCMGLLKLNGVAAASSYPARRADAPVEVPALQSPAPALPSTDSTTRAEGARPVANSVDQKAVA